MPHAIAILTGTGGCAWRLVVDEQWPLVQWPTGHPDGITAVDFA